MFARVPLAALHPVHGLLIKYQPLLGLSETVPQSSVSGILRLIIGTPAITPICLIPPMQLRHQQTD